MPYATKTCTATKINTGSGTPNANCAPTGPIINNIARNTVSFTIGSIGNIGGSTNDEWIMDESKNLINIRNGVE